MKLHESDNRGGITVKTYKEHLLIYISGTWLWFRDTDVKLLAWSFYYYYWWLLYSYSPLSSRLAALARDSTWVNSVKLLMWSCRSEAVDAKLLTWSCCTSCCTSSSGTSHSENGEADQSVRVLAEGRIVHGCSHFLSRGWSWYVSLSLSLSLSIFLCLSLWLSVSLSVCLCVSLSLSVSGFLISWSGSVSSPSFDNPAAILQTTAQLLVRLPVCLMLKSVFMVWASFNCRYCTATFHSTAAWTGWVAVVRILLFGTVF